MDERFLLKKKTFLMHCLQSDICLIFQYVHQQELLTQREYNNIYRNRPSNQTDEETIIKVIDILRDKGEYYCKRFLEILQIPDITDTIPALKKLDWSIVQPHVSPNAQTGSKSGNVKKGLTDVSGYVYNVSEIKRGSMKPYFTAVLQEEFESSNVIVFPIHLQARFAKAEKDRTSVKLEKVSLQLDCKWKIKFTEMSKFSILDHSLFNYNVNPDAVFKDTFLAALKANEGNKENAGSNKNLTLWVILKLQSGHRLTRAKEMLPMEEYLVGEIDANETTLANLTVWRGKHTVEVGKCYRVTNVAVGQYGDRITLNMTKDSTLVEVPSGGKCMVPPDMVQIETFTGNIIGHKLSRVYTCPQWHELEEVDTTEEMVACKECDQTYKSSSVKVIFNGKLSIACNMGNKVINVEDSVIKELLGERWEGTNNKELVVKALMELPPVVVRVLHGNVLSISIQDVATQDSNRITDLQRI